MKSLFVLPAIFAFTALMLLSCNKNDQSPSGNASGKTHINFFLKDGPAKYDAVYIDIQSIEVTMEGTAAVTYMPIRPGIYNLLELRNGTDTLLLRADMPPGNINQIRLILGSNNSVVVDGQTHMLTTPSAQESGLKLNLNQRFEAGGSYNVWLDFDASRSIVETGSGKYNLKPVIRAYSSLTDGRIKGYVQPASALVTVYASKGSEIYAAIPGPDGYYMFTGLPSGNYDVTFDAEALLYIDVTLKAVSVQYGQTTDLGTTVLIQ